MMGPIASLALVLAAQSPAQPTLPEWMLGDWTCHASPVPRGGPISTEEYWIRSGEAALVGVGRVRQYQTRQLEHMRIAPDATGRLTFYGSPGGAAPVAFPLARSGSQEVVFENPSHDFPQRVSYRLDGEHLIATVSLIDGGRAESWRFSRSGARGLQQPPCRPPGT